MEDSAEHRIVDAPKELIQEVKTKWNSTYCMLERFSNLYKSAIRGLADHMRHDLQLSRTDLDLIFTAVEALRPFEEATREMSGENFTTIAKVIPMVRGLKEQMSINLKKRNCPMAKELQAQLQQRFSCP